MMISANVRFLINEILLSVQK